MSIEKRLAQNYDSFDAGLTYGGLIHRLTISHDYGKTWAAWLDADTIFILKTK